MGERELDDVADSAADSLTTVRFAHHTVRRTLPVVEPDDALHRAEPLLAAAVALLCWQLDDDGATPAHTDSDAGPGAARSAIGAAMKSVQQLALDDESTADQVRSLVRDAAACLRRGAGRSEARTR